MHCLGVRLGLGLGLENKDQKKIEGTAKPLLATLDISYFLSITVE